MTFNFPIISCFGFQQDENFLSKDDEKFVEAIKKGFFTMDEKMKKHSLSWGRKQCGVPSAGTTVSNAIIFNGKIYVSYVGDSPVYIMKKMKRAENGNADFLVELVGVPHTSEFKEDYPKIVDSGGEIISADGEPAIRPRNKLINNNYLRMTRALGDFWMTDPDSGVKIISPEPEVLVFDIEKENIAYLLLTTDGLMLSKGMLGKYVLEACHKKCHIAQYLVRRMCSETSVSRLDNVSAISVGFRYQSSYKVLISDRFP